MAKLEIREVRQLILPTEAVVDALLQFDLERGGVLARGTLLEVEVEREPSPGLTLTVRLPGQQSSERRTFNMSMIAAAIIHYCYQSRIPLPRQAKKTLEVHPDGFGFTVETSIRLLQRHHRSPG